MASFLSILFIAFVLFFSPVVAFAQLRQESNTVATRVGNPAESNACGITRVFYSQADPQYQNTCDMLNSGCGPTTMAMIFSSFGDTITPNQMDAIFRERNWRECGDASRMEAAIKAYLPEKGYTYVPLPIKGGRGGLLDLAVAKEYLDNGYLIIGSTANHIFAMYGADQENNTIQLMDPARQENLNGVTRPNQYPWIVKDEERGWAYAYAVKKEGISCDAGTPVSGPVDSVCKGTPVSFGEKILLPRQTQLVCKATDSGACGRVDNCITPKKVVLHTTVSPADAAGIQNYFATGSSGYGVGTHFVVGKDGRTIQMVEMFTDKSEQTLGASYHNLDAIHIEMTDIGVYGSKNAAPAAQYQAVLSLVKKLMQQYHIPKGNIEYDWTAGSDSEKVSQPGVFGHYQLNPSNRTDPGIGFMRDFRQDL